MITKYYAFHILVPTLKRKKIQNYILCFKSSLLSVQPIIQLQIKHNKTIVQ